MLSYSEPSCASSADSYPIIDSLPSLRVSVLMDLSSVERLAKNDDWRRDKIRTNNSDQGSRFALLPFAISSSGLAGLLDPSRRGSGSFSWSFGGKRVGIGFGFGDLAELLQVLLDGAGSASDGVRRELERC